MTVALFSLDRVLQSGCLAVSLLYDLRELVLASRFSTDKRQVRLTNRGWWDIGRKRDGGARKMSVDLLGY